jgi:hypothetical protein
LKAKEHEEQTVDLLAPVTNDETQLPFSTQLPTSADGNSPAAPKREEPEGLSLETVANEQQDIQGQHSSRGQEEKAPMAVDLSRSEHPAGASRTIQQKEGDSMVNEPTQSSVEPFAMQTGRALKRRFTSAMFEEPKRRKMVQEPRTASSSLKRFPSGQMLKGVGGRSGKPKTGRTFSMPVPEDSVFFNAADVTIAGPLAPQTDVPMPSSPNSVSRGTPPSPEPIPSAQTDSHQASSPQDCERFTTNVGNKGDEAVGQNEDLGTGGDNQSSGLSERMLLRETDELTVIGMGGECNEGSLQRDGELHSNRPNIALQPPDVSHRISIRASDLTSLTLIIRSYSLVDQQRRQGVLKPTRLQRIPSEFRSSIANNRKRRRLRTSHWWYSL